LHRCDPLNPDDLQMSLFPMNLYGALAFLKVHLPLDVTWADSQIWFGKGIFSSFIFTSSKSIIAFANLDVRTS
jgi:hypothetical protein